MRHLIKIASLITSEHVRKIFAAVALAVTGGPIALGAGIESATAATGNTENRLWLTVMNLASVCFFALWWWSTKLKAAAGRPQNISPALASFGPEAEAQWQARALAAEARAAKATALLKSRLMPQLARWMMGELVQKLLHQRSSLTNSQREAEVEVAELEQRLENLHAPLEERLRAYERRVADLEKELAAKGEENRELIKAKIDTARKRLESERAKSPVSWN